MHEDAIHDLASDVWSEPLSPIKRAADKTNLARWEIVRHSRTEAEKSTAEK
jgi:hypothetical protein